VNEGLISLWLALVAGTPLLLVAALLLPWRERLVTLTPWTALPALAAVLWLPNGAGAHYPWLMLGFGLGIDATGRGFLLLTALLWLAAGIYALGYLRESTRKVEFHAWYLLAMAGNLWLVLATDVIGFYGGFTLMSLAAYGLVVFERRDEVWRAGRVYIMLAIVGEILLLAGLMMHVYGQGTLLFAGLVSDPPRGLALSALIVGLGIKAGLLPLHVWLPLAHPAAPTPASAVLSGAMIKAGLLGWLRLLPVGDGGLPEAGVVLIVLGLAGAYFGNIVGLAQRRPKTILAYSSISQMGLMTTGVGLALALPGAGATLLAAIVLYALHHGIAKAALFLAVSVSERVRGAWVTGLIALPALALAGLPFTSGAAAKSALKAPLADASAAWVSGVEWLLAFAAAGTTLLMLRLFVCLRAAAVRSAALPLSMGVPWAALSLGAVVLPWLWLPEFALAALAPAKLWAVSWPLLFGFVLFAIAMRSGMRMPAWPEGDLWSVLERLGARMSRLATTVVEAWRLPGTRAIKGITVAGMNGWRRARILAGRAEARLTRWDNLGQVFIALIVVIFLLLWLTPATAAGRVPDAAGADGRPVDQSQPAANGSLIFAVGAAESGEQRALLGNDLETRQVQDEDRERHEHEEIGYVQSPPCQYQQEPQIHRVPAETKDAGHDQGRSQFRPGGVDRRLLTVKRGNGDKTDHHAEDGDQPHHHWLPRERERQRRGN
jgi:hydrogenase-4 component B